MDSTTPSVVFRDPFGAAVGPPSDSRLGVSGNGPALHGDPPLDTSLGAQATQQSRNSEELYARPTESIPVPPVAESDTTKTTPSIDLHSVRFATVDDDDDTCQKHNPGSRPTNYPTWLRWTRRKDGDGGFHIVTRRAMVGTFLLALAAAIANYAFFRVVAGRVVGNLIAQQQTRFVANFVPYVVHTSLVVSVDIAMTQWLFRCLRHRAVSVKCLDAAYSASSSFIFLFSHDMYRVLPDVLVLAVVLALLTVPTTMITPGTLYVVQGEQAVSRILPVPCVDMGHDNISQSGYFQVSRAANGPSSGGDNDDNTATASSSAGGSDATAMVFGGPRTILTRLSAAAGATGEILAMSSTPGSAVNATYAVEFYGPYVGCEPANSTVTALVDAAAASAASAAAAAAGDNGIANNATEVYNGYFAYVPDLSTAAAAAGRWGQVNVRDSDAARASNELWLSFKRNSSAGWTMDPFPRCPLTEYRVCRLYNASYHLNVTYANGQMVVDYDSAHLLGASSAAVPVPYPGEVTDTTQSGTLSYSAYMWSFTALLSGSLGLYVQQNATSSSASSSSSSSSSYSYNVISSNIENTRLLGSADLDCFFAVDWLFDNDTWQPNSPQRLRDIAFAAGGQSLDVLLPELSANLTISLMNDDLLGPPVLRNVTVFEAVDRYAFHAPTLLAAYGAALAAGLAANILGLVAFACNRVRVDKSFSSTASATQHTHLVDADHYGRRGSVPMPAPVRRKQVLFRELEPGNGGGWGFVVV